MSIRYQVKITPAILNLISEIDEFKGKWQAINTLSPDRLRMLKKSATIESIASSTRIEGVKLTDEQVETLLSKVRKKSFKNRDEEEVAGYSDAMNLILENFEDLKLTENHIKQLHSILLKHSSKDIRHRGEYKKLNNHVVAFDSSGKEIGIVFKTATPFETPMKMADLVEWTNKTIQLRETHPLISAGIFIVIFLAIHPFQDGNGRLSRILTNLLLLKLDYSYVQYSSLESIIEDNKDLYYKNLRDCQITLDSKKPKFENWILFFLKSLKKQKDNLEKKVKAEKILQENFHPLHLEILKILKNHDRLSVSEIQNLSGANRNTLKVKLRELVEMKKIRAFGKGRGVAYALA
ncbi:MAG: Bacterial regulatory protein AsnC family [Rickettsiaceae bacterium]|jgi:Fic family protein|nr:Bacterial regulatory protein AsnC family [Rickettsiaceae bacterium]